MAETLYTPIDFRRLPTRVKTAYHTYLWSELPPEHMTKAKNRVYFLLILAPIQWISCAGIAVLIYLLGNLWLGDPFLAICLFIGFFWVVANLFVLFDEWTTRFFERLEEKGYPENDLRARDFWTNYAIDALLPARQLSTFRLAIKRYRYEKQKYEAVKKDCRIPLLRRLDRLVMKWNNNNKSFRTEENHKELVALWMQIDEEMLKGKLGANDIEPPEDPATDLERQFRC